MFNKNIKKLGLLSRAMGLVVPAIAVLCAPVTDLRANEAEDLPAKVSVSNNRDARIHLVDDVDGDLTLINPATSVKAESPRTIVFLPPSEDAQVELVEGFKGRNISGLRLYRESTDGDTWEDPDSPGFPVTILDSTSGIPGPMRPMGLSADDLHLFAASCADGGQGPCELWALERRSDCPTTLPGGFRAPVLLDGNMCATDDGGVCALLVTSVSETHILPITISGQAGKFGAGDVFVAADSTVLRYAAEDIAAALNPDPGDDSCPAGDPITPQTLIGPFGSNLGIAQGADGDAWSGFDFNPVAGHEMLIENDTGSVRVFDLDGGAFGTDFVKGLAAGDAKIDAELDHQARPAAYIALRDSSLVFKFLIGMDGDGNTVAVDENGDPTGDPVAPFPVNAGISVPSDVSATNFVVFAAEECLSDDGCNGTGLANHQLPEGAVAEGNVAETLVVSADPRDCTASGERLSIQDLDMGLPDVDVTPEICGQPQVAIVETIAPGVIIDRGVVDHTLFGDILQGGHLPCWEPGDGGAVPAPDGQSVGLYGPRPGMEPDIIEYLDGDPELIELSSSCGSDRLKSKGLSLFGINWVYAPDTDFRKVIDTKIDAARSTLRVSECDLDEVWILNCLFGRILLNFEFRILKMHWAADNKIVALIVLRDMIELVEKPDNAGIFNLGENNFQGDLDSRLKNIAFTILSKDVCQETPGDAFCTTRLPWSVRDQQVANSGATTTIRTRNHRPVHRRARDTSATGVRENSAERAEKPQAQHSTRQTQHNANQETRQSEK